MAATSRLTLHTFLLKLFILFIITAAVSILGLLAGSVDVSISDIFNLFTSKNFNGTISQIILEIRLPRVLLSIAVGGGLSVAGAVFQAMLMNPLAEPYILGISSGGTFGAILAMLLGIAFIWAQLFAFIGALCVMALVFVLGKRFGELEPNVMLLTGIMVGAFFSAAILMMMTMLGDSLRSAIFWLIGNLSLANPETIYYVLPTTIVISIILSLNGQKYNVLSMGSDNAKHLGVNTVFVKNSTYILASIMVGSIVSVSGIVGFVGLLVPHFCRMIFGVDNRIIVPASFFVGASYLVLADMLARSLISPAELPVGAVTALIGAPIFIYLLRKRFNLIK
ncbi:FecCD family ABC transporter permease [Bacteroidota bacterium]